LQDLVKEKKVNNEYIKLNILNKDQRFNNTKYDNLIIQFCKKYSDKRHVDPALIKILMYKESKFDPKARSGA
jgi:soluble lytic murein transglycosylase-like protein